VGSQTLVKRFDVPASPPPGVPPMGVAGAEKVCLSSPNLRRGFPSQLGYRLFVDDLLPAPGAGALAGAVNCCAEA